MSNIVLIGFMGTGKSTVGRVLSKMLGYDFIDSDTEIERKAGMPLKDIFSQHGEGYFRELEREIIMQLAHNTRCVIATGGGVVLDKRNMDTLSSSGIVICLKAKPEVILERVGKSDTRPLLSENDPLEAINRILTDRKDLYHGDLSLDTSRMDPEAVALRIKAFTASRKQNASFSMQFGSVTCEVISGSRLLEDLHKYIETFYPSGKILIVSNPTIHELWGSKLQASLAGHYSIDWCIIPDGEEYKNMDSILTIYDKAAQTKLTRDSLIIGFGGGVIGDMAGFAAATYMRGIPYIQIPTTLLSQVDSSIGGKTAINHREGKNLIGSFYQPGMVIADTDLLLTLPPGELNSGLAEVIKYGIIADYDFFEYLERNIDEILKLQQKALSHIIISSCRIKASLVQQDERDYGPRILLNYGHTIGHAIEAAAGYKLFRHGEAVALGMEAAAYIAQSMGLLKEADGLSQKRLMEKAGLPIRYPNMDSNRVLSLMNLDKKALDGRLRFVLPKSLGSAAVYDNIPSDCIKAALEYLKG